jgi:hypothetical protein
MKSMLKAPGSKRLKLVYDESPSNFAFKFNLRRYTLVSYLYFTDPTMGVTAADITARI